jgi:hypothetical protein
MATVLNVTRLPLMIRGMTLKFCINRELLYFAKGMKDAAMFPTERAHIHKQK